MSWIQVESIIRGKIISKMAASDQPKAEKWLQGLRTCKDGHCLGVCIAIDVESGGLDPQVYADILAQVSFPFSDAREEFGRIVSNPKYLGLTNFVSKGLPSSDSYVRILDLADFIEYYVHPDFKLTSSPRDIHVVRKMFLDKKRPADLALIRNWTAGPTGRVWILSSKDFDAIKKHRSSNQCTTYLNDALGLGYTRTVGTPPRIEIVALFYPKNLGVGVFQPTTLDGSWIRPGGNYVAFGDFDSWGRTHSITGTKKPVRERIHSSFKGLTSDYKVEQVGLSRTFRANRARMLSEAFRRLDRITNGLPPFP